MLEIRTMVLPLKKESNDTNPTHGPGGNSTCSTKPKCGAKTRACGGHPCRRIAGHGTNHLSTGRCKYHGGCSPITHGSYSTVVAAKRRASYEAALAATDPQSMLEHLALLNGMIIPAALERGEGAPSGPGHTDPLDLQLKAIDIKSKVV